MISPASRKVARAVIYFERNHLMKSIIPVLPSIRTRLLLGCLWLLLPALLGCQPLLAAMNEGSASAPTATPTWLPLPTDTPTVVPATPPPNRPTATASPTATLAQALPEPSPTLMVTPAPEDGY